MKRTALARGPLRLSRKAPLARSASARPSRRVSASTGDTGTARRPAQRAQGARTAPGEGGWPGHVREAVSSRSKGVCEICWSQPATDLHHRKRRREGDHTIPNALHLCRTCHSGAHQHPAEARAYGWIVPTWDDPRATTALIGGSRWVLLEPDGTYRTASDAWPLLASPRGPLQ